MKFLLAALFTLVIVTTTSAQPMPDREETIAKIVAAKYQSMLNGDDVRRQQILGMLCRDLNVIDGNNWSLLIKNDRNPPGLPADTLVWKPTREHVDALADFGPAWILRGVLPDPRWNPLPCPEGPMPDPVEPAPLPVPIPYDLAAIKKLLDDQAVRLGIVIPQLDRIELKVNEVGTSMKEVAGWIGKFLSGPIVAALVTWFLTRDDPTADP